MCMNCVSQSLPYVAMALGGLQLPRVLARRGGGPSGDDEGGERRDQHDDADEQLGDARRARDGSHQ